MQSRHRYFWPVFLCFLVTLSACSSGVRAPVSGPSTQKQADTAVSSSSREQGFHVVKSGDTLYSIAWRYGLDFKNVAAWNNIKPPYIIYPAQKLTLQPVPGARISRQEPAAEPVPPPGPRPVTVPEKTTAVPPRQVSSNAQTVDGQRVDIRWQWPTAGRVVNINLPTSAKGLNISGEVGQSVKAAAAGEVVYSGSGLLGYGNLIIIKHNDTYLSAYAHNEQILIKEGTKVTPGQNIATMGTGKNGMPLLHFEIRKDGKPVDPIKYLPDRKS